MLASMTTETPEAPGTPETAVFDGLAWPRRTARLTLRPATERDVEPIWQIRRLEAVGHWMTSAAETLEEHAARFGAKLARALVVERDGAIVGDLYLSVEDAWSQSEVAEQARGVQAEIGWCLDPAVQGKGYATEAVEELLRICFEDLGLRRVVANCFADNVPSWRLMERVGMRREAYAVRESLHRSGAWLDGLGYALLADEWRDRVGRT